MGSGEHICDDYSLQIGSSVALDDFEEFMKFQVSDLKNKVSRGL